MMRKLSSAALKELVQHNQRTDDADAFIRHPDENHARSNDSLAEGLGEGFVRSVTSAGDDEPFLDDTVSEEIGGPFLVTTFTEEVAIDDDGNPLDAEPAGFPTAVGSLAVLPDVDEGLRDEE